MGRGQTHPTPRYKLARPDHQKGNDEGMEMVSLRQRQCGVSEEMGWIEVTMISPVVEISITGGVVDTEDV